MLQAPLFCHLPRLSRLSWRAVELDVERAVGRAVGVPGLSRYLFSTVGEWDAVRNRKSGYEVVTNGCV